MASADKTKTANVNENSRQFFFSIINTPSRFLGRSYSIRYIYFNANTFLALSQSFLWSCPPIILALISNGWYQENAASGLLRISILDVHVKRTFYMGINFLRNRKVFRRNSYLWIPSFFCILAHKDILEDLWRMPNNSSETWSKGGISFVFDSCIMSPCVHKHKPESYNWSFLRQTNRHFL